MRRARLAWLGMLALSLAGCLSDRPARSTSLIDRFRTVGGPNGPDAVIIEYYLVERPAGDTAMNRQIWKHIDEVAISPSETRALLAENGFRCGVIGGLLPAELEAMIQNPNGPYKVGRERRLYVSNPAAISVSGPVTLAEFQVRPTLEASETTARFEKAKFSMTFTPTHGENGRINLKCVPEIEFHDKKRWTPVGAAGDGWADTKPLERYAALTVDVSLSPREFLVIGADHDRGKWLGNQMFNDTVGVEKVQRLLVVRVTRLSEKTGAPPSNGKPTQQDGVVPLAFQAQTTASRGVKP